MVKLILSILLIGAVSTEALKQDVPKTEKVRCHAATKSGTQCKRKAASGTMYCKQHAAEVEVKNTPDKCRAVDDKGARCDEAPKEHRNYCEKHMLPRAEDADKNEMK